MKIAAVLASLVLAVATTHAAECSSETISSTQAKPEYEKLMSACSSVMSSIGSTTTASSAQAAAKKMCEDKSCMNALADVVKVFPDCTVHGVTFKKTYEDQYTQIQSQCKQLVGSSSASSTVSATAAATAAAVVVFAQL